MLENRITALKCLLLICSIGIASCNNKKTPEDLAKEACECYREAKSFSNTTKKLKKIDECFNLVQSNLSELRSLGKKNDWNDAQVQEAETKFDNIYSKCSE